MDNKHLPSSNQQDPEYGHGLACRIACEQLSRIDDMEQLCLRSGAGYQVTEHQGMITLEYLNQMCQIILPQCYISVPDSPAEVSLREKILMLHYLVQAKGTPPTGKLIAYKELPEGANYFPTFTRRAIRPVIDHFGKEPDRLLTSAEKLGGHRAGHGDAAVTINAFPRVPITVVLWRGDDEFPPEASILFDSTVASYLTPEDINVLCEIIAWKLVRYAQPGIS